MDLHAQMSGAPRPARAVPTGWGYRSAEGKGNRVTEAAYARVAPSGAPEDGPWPAPIARSHAEGSLTITVSRGASVWVRSGAEENAIWLVRARSGPSATDR